MKDVSVSHISGRVTTTFRSHTLQAELRLCFSLTQFRQSYDYVSVSHTSVRVTTMFRPHTFQAKWRLCFGLTHFTQWFVSLANNDFRQHMSSVAYNGLIHYNYCIFSLIKCISFARGSFINPWVRCNCHRNIANILNTIQGLRSRYTLFVIHDDVIKWKHFPRYWSFVRGIHRQIPSQRPVMYE